MPLSEFDENRHPTAPVLFTLGCREWPALTRWSPEYFKSLAPSQRVRVRVSKSGDYRYRPDASPVDPEDQYEIEDATLEEATAWITSDRPGAPKYYITQLDVGDRLPQLFADLRFPASQRLMPPTLWFGSSGTTSQLHFDRGSNLYCQVYGEKQFTLFSPADTPFLYPYPEDCSLSHVSDVDVGRPDLTRHPLFVVADAIVVTLHAGDVLFLPAYWWHYVRSLSVSISVNQWWREELTERGTPNAVPLLRTEYHQWLHHPETAPRGRQLASWIDGATALLRTNPVAAALAAACGVAEWSDATQSRLEEWVVDPVFFQKWRRITSIAAAGNVTTLSTAFAADVAFCLEELRTTVRPHAPHA